MFALVTGAYGHLGTNLVHELLAQGWAVRAFDLQRGRSLDGLSVEHVTGDVLEQAAVAAAMVDVDVVFHLAARISIVGDPRGHVRRTNVDGTATVARAALDGDVGRMVHCSSVHAFDLTATVGALDETSQRAIRSHLPAYDRSKYEGEQRVQTMVAQGLDAVIVNPTGIIGPLDYGPSRMGSMLRVMAAGRLPIAVEGGFDFVDARDVARSVVAAADRGTTGHNYLLSGTHVSVRDLAAKVAGTTGRRAPLATLPMSIAAPIARASFPIVRRSKQPAFTPEALHALRHAPVVDDTRARHTLGHASRPLEETIGDVLTWFAAGSD